ncbi:hypothetical protein V1512DRAFT_257394 [Lipomyces arxii]|uniref:uncharacterized protein n=1 Tax=Lipomyces arxii TaxID=56418 RepID=UPI0034CED781
MREANVEDVADLLSQTVRRTNELYTQVRDAVDVFESAIAHRETTYMWSVGPQFLRKFLIRVEKELCALNELVATDDLKIAHRLRSTNLPNAQSAWSVFASGVYPGIVSLGSGVKPGSSGGYSGDVTAEHGSLVLLVSRMTIDRLRRELAILQYEMADDEDECTLQELVPSLDLYRSTMKLVYEVSAPVDCNAILADSNNEFPRLLKPVELKLRSVKLVFVNIDLDHSSVEDVQLFHAVSEIISKQLNVQIDARTFTRLPAESLITNMIRYDSAFFLKHISTTLNFDVTGLLSIVSDITNLPPVDAIARLDGQRDGSSGPPGKSYVHRKSSNAFAFLRKQIEAERAFRSTKTTMRVLCDNRSLQCTEAVKNKLVDMAIKMGSRDEQRRVNDLFDMSEEGKMKIYVVNDEGLNTTTVTGNYRQAKEHSNDRSMLVIESRSLLGEHYVNNM